MMVRFVSFRFRDVGSVDDNVCWFISYIFLLKRTFVACGVPDAAGRLLLAPTGALLMTAGVGCVSPGIVPLLMATSL